MKLVTVPSWKPWRSIESPIWAREAGHGGAVEHRHADLAGIDAGSLAPAVGLVLLRLLLGGALGRLGGGLAVVVARELKHAEPDRQQGEKRAPHDRHGAPRAGEQHRGRRLRRPRHPAGCPCRAAGMRLGRSTPIGTVGRRGGGGAGGAGTAGESSRYSWLIVVDVLVVVLGPRLAVGCRPPRRMPRLVALSRPRPPPGEWAADGSTVSCDTTACSSVPLLLSVASSSSSVFGAALAPAGVAAAGPWPPRERRRGRRGRRHGGGGGGHGLGSGHGRSGAAGTGLAPGTAGLAAGGLGTGGLGTGWATTRPRLRCCRCARAHGRPIRAGASRRAPARSRAPTARRAPATAASPA